MNDNNQRKSTTKNISSKRMVIMVAIVAVIATIGIIIYENIFKKSETYTVVNGYVEKTNNTQAVVIKEEVVVNLNTSNAILPLIEQGKRVRKSESVAIYKDSKYEEYNNTIKELDKQIENLIKDLPQTYSNDISYIENQIELIGKKAQNTTSYIKMQEYKSKMDELSNQKVTLLAQLSPSGSKIRELIDQRTKIEEGYKNLSDNIKSPISGCVTYKIDGLEKYTDISKVINYSMVDIDNIFNKYKENVSNDFGIKIINNFNAYIIIKTQNNEYMKEGYNYSITFNDKSNLRENTMLKKIINIDDSKKYCIFEIFNGIENLVDSRIENVEVIWTKKKGMAVPLNSINLNQNSNIGKVIVIKNGDYLETYIKVVLSNDNIAIVENLTQEERESNNIQNNNTLEIFDQLVIKESN